MAIAHSPLIFILTSLLLGCTQGEKDTNTLIDTGPDDVATWIANAGNASSEQARYDLLEGLRASLDDTDPLAFELDTLLPIIDQWAYGLEKYWVAGDQEHSGENGYLAGFFTQNTWPSAWGPVYPPEVELASQLHPIWALYRGRMLIWWAIQNDFLSADYFSEGRAILDIAYEAFPDNPVLPFYLGETVPWESNLEEVPTAPEWANLQREALHKLYDIITYWIEYRQAEDGQFGGGWGDDVEMWRNWTPILVGFDSQEINAAQTRLSEGIFDLPRMAGGYTNILTDVEHSSEDSGDTLTAMLHIDQDNPLWQDRAQHIGTLMSELWTAENDQGFLQFQSTYFSANEVDPSPEHACDTTYHTRAIQPALLFWQRTGDYYLGVLFEDWLTTWVDVAARKENGKPAGVLPSAIHFPSGEAGGPQQDWWNPGCHYSEDTYAWPRALERLSHALVLAASMTGNTDFLAPLVSMAALRADYLDNPVTDFEKGDASYVGSELNFVADALAKWWLLTGEDSDLAPIESDLGGYVEFLRTGDTAPLLEGLEDTVTAFSVNEAAYTSEVRYTDRIFKFHKKYANDHLDTAIPNPNIGLLYMMVTGDINTPQTYPLNGVRWLTEPLDLAVWVEQNLTTYFQATLFHFGASERSMGAELLRLQSGSYDWDLSCEDFSQASGVVKIKGPPEDNPQRILDFQLPSQTPCLLSVASTKEDDT